MRKTNDQKLRALVKELCDSDILIPVVAVERLLTISEATRNGIKNNPKDYDNPVFNHSYYVKFCDIVDKHLK